MENAIPLDYPERKPVKERKEIDWPSRSVLLENIAAYGLRGYAEILGISYYTLYYHCTLDEDLRIQQLKRAPRKPRVPKEPRIGPPRPSFWKEETIMRWFWRRVKKTDACWIWTGARLKCSMPDGYGVLQVRGKTLPVHRFIYEKLKGPIPSGCEIHHTCENTLCVNPDHLESLTPQQHHIIGNGIAARCSRKTHCVHGHALAGDNVRIVTRRDGRKLRLCRICRNAALVLYRQRVARQQRKCKKQPRPSSEQLLRDVDELGKVHTGVKYGVNESTIRAWLKLIDTKNAALI